MTLHSKVLLFLLLSLPIKGFGQQQSGNNFFPKRTTYIWPTDASHYLSSSFAETRAGHFHAALDLKTWGRRGYNVFATRDGILHRIAIGPRGYGKVVYLKHNDGSYSVYAHLMRFNKNIQQLADSIRISRGYVFAIDEVLDSLDIEIKQGEVIGLSGASGIGPPHLHFELRTPEERPFNPLLTNLSIRDDIPPHFSALSVEPLSPYSQIEGATRIYTKQASQKEGSYTFSSIDIQGPVGLGVNVFDQADKVYNSYAVYQLKMYVDGNLLFHSKVDSFSYGETHQLYLDRVYSILKHSGSGYQRLYIADGNTLPFYQPTGSSGKLNLQAGIHHVRIVASDFFGNTSEAKLQLKVHSSTMGSSASIPLRQIKSTDDKEVSGPESWQWFDNWVTLPKKTAGKYVIARLSPKKNDSYITSGSDVNITLDQTRDLFFRRNTRDHFIMRRVYPGSLTIIPATDHDAYATFQPQTVYDTLSAGIRTKSYSPDSIKVEVFPSSQPLKNDYKLAYRVDSATAVIPKLAFYEYNPRKNRYKYLPTSLKESYLLTYPDEFGIFFALQDTVAPEVTSPRIEQRPDGRWIVALNVKDNRSGIDEGKNVCYLNGVQGIAEYAPEDNLLICYQPHFIPLNENTLRVRIFDRLGNHTEQEFTLPLKVKK